MPPRKSSTPAKKAKTPKKSTVSPDDASEDVPAVPVLAQDQNEIDRLEEEFLLEEALDEVPQDDLEEMPVEPAAEGEGEGEGEDLQEQPVEPDDDGDERMDVDELPAPRSEEDAPAAASGSRLRIRLAGAAPSSPAANPPPTPSEALQEMAAITTNWGAQFRTLRDCMPREPKGTWLRGSTSGLTEHTCEFKTLRKFRKLSDQTPNDGSAMMQQIRWRWEDRNNSGRVGTKKFEKERNLRHDLRSATRGEKWTEADVQKSKKKRKENDAGAPAAKRLRSCRKDSQRPSQGDEDDSSSGSDSIRHDGPAPKNADDGGKAAAIAKKNEKVPTTGAASNAMQATQQRSGGPTIRATTAIIRERPSMRELKRGVPLPTLGTTRPSASEMIGRSFGDDRSPGEPMVRPGDRVSRENPLPPNRLSSSSRNMLPMPGRRDSPTQLGGQRPSHAGNMVAPSYLRVLLREAQHDATRADEEAAANMHRYEHSVLTAVDRHREVERLLGMVAQEDGGAEGGGHGKDGDDGKEGGQDNGSVKKKR